MKKTIVIVLGLLVLLLVPIVAIGVSSFGGLVPLTDESLGGFGEIVADGHVGIGVVDVGEDHVALAGRPITRIVFSHTGSAAGSAALEAFGR